MNLKPILLLLCLGCVCVGAFWTPWRAQVTDGKLVMVTRITWCSVLTPPTQGIPGQSSTIAWDVLAVMAISGGAALALVPSLIRMSATVARRAMNQRFKITIAIGIAALLGIVYYLQKLEKLL
jgi:hypothetical protein